MINPEEELNINIGLSDEKSKIYSSNLKKYIDIMKDSAWAVGDIRWSAATPGSDWIPADGRRVNKDVWPSLASLSASWGQHHATEPLDAFKEESSGIWVPRTDVRSLFRGGRIRLLMAGDGVILAIGNRGGRGITTVLGRSDDTTSWTETPSAASIFGFGYAQNITAGTWGSHPDGKGLFVVGSEYGRLATSTDGKTWTRQESPLGNKICGVAFRPGSTLGHAKEQSSFLAVDGSGALAMSSNGTQWSHGLHCGLREGLGMDQALSHGIIANGRSLFVIASRTGQISTSLDGMQWAKTQAVSRNNAICCLTWGKTGNSAGTFVAGCKDGTIAISTDGKEWSARTSGLDQINTLCSVPQPDGGSVFVAGGNRGRLVMSNDGRTWHPMPVFPDISEPCDVYSLLSSHGHLIGAGSRSTLATLIRSCEKAQMRTMPSIQNTDIGNSFLVPDVLPVAGMHAYIKGR